MDWSPLAHARRGAVFGILAALLLANPLYIGMFIEEPRSRSPTGYTATAVDPANASDQQYIIQRLGDDEILSRGELSREGQYDPYGPRYRALDGAAEVIRRAHEKGSARTTNGTVAFTLHRFGANHRFTSFEGEGDQRQYYRLDVTDRNESAVVTLEAVNRSTVAHYVVYSDARLYGSLPRYQRQTVDAVIAADEHGYRPYNDEFREITDDLVVKNDTYYVFQESMHVDDFGPSKQTIASVLLYALGFLLLVAAVLSTMAAYRSESAEE